MIVVTLTSWVKRINYVKRVIESIMNNTIQPDRVYLNLSQTEFEGIELPQDLVDYFNSDPRLIINWVSGPNTKSMKKIFPILEYLQDEDIIIDADDDILFPSDLIASRLKDFYGNNRKYCISSNPHKSVGFGGQMVVVSAISLFQKKMLKNWEKFLTQRILDTNNDDRTYLHLVWLNGYRNKGCTKWSVQELLKEYDMNIGNNLGTVTSFIGGKLYDNVAKEEFYKDKDIIKSFGLWKTKE